MDYSLHQRGRASIEFLVDLRNQSNRLETSADQFAEQHGLSEQNLPDDAQGLQERISPIVMNCLDFRMLRLMRDWTLDCHGSIAMDAFEEIRAEIEPELEKLGNGPTDIRYRPELIAPAYWDGYEFHRSTGGWDGHDYMGFVHGEICHRKMIGSTFADAILAIRAATAKLVPEPAPAKILEMGCGSAQYTLGLATAYPESEIWACDLSPRQLEEARRRANQQGFSWNLIQAAAENTGLAAENFDLVTSFAVFHELPSDVAQAVLAESYRLLKPGGYTLVGDVKPYHVLNRYERWKADFWNYQHGGDPYWRDYATSDLAAMATAAGFTDARWAGVGESQYPFVLIARKP